MLRPHQAESHVVEYCPTKQDRLLLYKANLCAKPSDIEFLDIDTVKGYRTGCLIIPALDKSNYGALP